MDLHEAEALFAITLSRARTASPACGRRQKVREIVRIKREGGRVERGERERGRDGGDLIIYRKKAVPHFSPPPSLSLSLSVAPLRRGSLAPRARTFSSSSRRTRCCTLRKHRGRRDPSRVITHCSQFTPLPILETWINMILYNL